MNVTGQIRVATMSGEIKYVGDVGPRGAEGPEGKKGERGKNIEYNWEGTSLGIRQEGENEYRYTDLQGPQGQDGQAGESITNVEINSDGELVITIG